jgi:hypothetical protein
MKINNKISILSIGNDNQTKKLIKINNEINFLTSNEMRLESAKMMKDGMNTTIQ